MSHSPEYPLEPWTVAVNPFGHTEGTPDNIFILNAEGSYVAVVQHHPVWKHLDNARRELAERIVASVNACKGIPTKVLTLEDQPVIFLSRWQVAYIKHNAESIPADIPIDCSTFRKFVEHVSKLPNLPEIVCSKCRDKITQAPRCP